MFIYFEHAMSIFHNDIACSKFECVVFFSFVVSSMHLNITKISFIRYFYTVFFSTQFSDVLLYTSRTATPSLQFKVHGQLLLRGMSVSLFEELILCIIVWRLRIMSLVTTTKNMHSFIAISSPLEWSIKAAPVRVQAWREGKQKPLVNNANRHNLVININ